MALEHTYTYTYGVPVEVSWKLVKKGDVLLTKVLPSYFAKIDVLEGNGGPGTVRVVTLGEGVGPEGEGKTVKERIEVLDDATLTLVYSTLEGGDPRYKDLKFTTVFSTGPGNSTVVKTTIHYTPVNDSVPPPKHFEALAETSGKAIEKFAKEHPEEFA